MITITWKMTFGKEGLSTLHLATLRHACIYTTIVGRNTGRQASLMDREAIVVQEKMSVLLGKVIITP